MDSVKNAYNKICDDWCAVRDNNAINACIAEFCEAFEAGDKILDVGCGSGAPVDKYLSERGFFVTGIDISEKMLDRARARELKNCRFIRADLLDYESEEIFDGVIAFDSLWHIGYGDQERIYGKLASLLKRGGKLLFTHGRTDGEITGSMFGTEFYYSALGGERIKTLLEQNGFEICAFLTDYKEKTTGERDLLVVAEKL